MRAPLMGMMGAAGSPSPLPRYNKDDKAYAHRGFGYANVPFWTRTSLWVMQHRFYVGGAYLVLIHLVMYLSLAHRSHACLPVKGG